MLRRMIADGVRVNCVITSPPYWGLRSYLDDGHGKLQDDRITQQGFAFS